MLIYLIVFFEVLIMLYTVMHDPHFFGDIASPGLSGNVGNQLNYTISKRLFIIFLLIGAALWATLKQHGTAL